jgi:MFS family permease
MCRFEISQKPQLTLKRFIMGGQEIGKPPRRQSEFFYGYFVVGASLLIMSVMWAAYYAFGVFFNPVVNEFGWTRAMTSGAFSLASMVTGLLTIAMGGLTDRFGARIVMTLCGLFLGSGFFLISRIHALWHLYLLYGLLVGAGMSGSFVPLLSTVARWFVKRRGIMTGIVAAGSGIGALIGPPGACELISIYGWRVSYAVLGSIVLLAVVLPAQIIKRDPAQVGQVAYGSADEKERLLSPGSDGFSLVEVIHRRQFWILFAAGLFYGFCFFTVMVHLVPHAIELGISAIRAASLLAVIGGTGVLGKVILGRTGDVIGNRRILVLGFTLMSAALIWLAQAKTPWMLFLIAVIFGFGYGGCNVAISPIIAELFGLKSHGLIFGVYNISVMSGSALGPLLTGYIFDVTNRYQLAFVICAVINLIGTLLVIWLNKSGAKCLEGSR